jgi:hypothetical protein
VYLVIGRGSRQNAIAPHICWLLLRRCFDLDGHRFRTQVTGFRIWLFLIRLPLFPR